MEENIRDLENQRHELDKKIKQYYEKEEMCRIRHNEEKYVGKCYKIDDGESTVYIKNRRSTVASTTMRNIAQG